MQMILSPNRWSCLPASFCMAVGCQLPYMLDKVGHDGSEIIWPGKPEPRCRRSFHIQEMLDFSVGMGFCFMPIEAVPLSAISPEDKYYQPFSLEDADVRMRRWLVGREGVLIGTTPRCPHAVAWDGTHIWDPNGCRYRISDTDFNITEFWVKFEIKSSFENSS